MSLEAKKNPPAFSAVAFAPLQSQPSITGSYRARSSRVASSLLANGEPMLWLTGGGLVIALAMIVGLLGLVFYQGFSTFWPRALVQLQTRSGTVYLGEVVRGDTFEPEPGYLETLSPAAAAAARSEMFGRGGVLHRRLLRTGNFELTNEHFTWVNDFEVVRGGETDPEWAVLFERLTWGRFYGFPVRFLEDGVVTATTPAEVWERFRRFHPEVRERYEQRRRLETVEIGRLNYELERARLGLRGVELDHGTESPEYREEKARYAARSAEIERESAAINRRIAELDAENGRFVLVARTADGREQDLLVADVVRAFPPNQLGLGGKIGVYLSRWWEFLSDAPREANSEGGVFPAIFGTVVMTLVMTILVVPFGVLAALYLREYAKAGPLVSAVRISINNLAGVPSIVFGVFGLGFFCYIIGGSIDRLFFAPKLPNPTFGTGGLLWASLTLALLTLPVVIVAAEEALAAVPGSMREGSYACGASKWQTIRRIVLPRALPGIMTGAILAMARGAGEVAPLMLVGAVKLAPELPIDGNFPYLHAERSFMHLGFHIFDLGFQSQNSEAAKPMVFTTTLLLILIITFLNVTAVWLRTRLRRKFVDAQF
jgi:phosphate transport system permease protein